MTPLSVAIIGAGHIAGNYDENTQQGGTGIYTHAGAYTAHNGFVLKTVCDQDAARAEKFRRIWQAGHIATNLEEICGSRHDVISICTPDHAHFDIARSILAAGCCRTIFIEKPLSADVGQIEELIRLGEQRNIHIVTNFQRRNEPAHKEIREHVAANPNNLLSVTGHYMKGLRHIGITMIDTLSYLCGQPDAALAYNRVFNQEIGDYSYEFVLYYPGFTATVKTTDADRFYYNYHIFEIDLLFTDGRLTIVDISQGIREAPVTDYTYSGVKIMNDREAQYRETGYKLSMMNAIEYIYGVTTGEIAHRINTPQASYNNLLILNHIIESFDRGSEKLDFAQKLWKK